MSDGSMPLVFLKEGKSGKVECIQGGEMASKKLMEMGMNTGALVEIIKNEIGRPLILSIGERRIVLGQCMARKVRVMQTQ